MLLGYDPGRVRALATRTAAAIDELAAIDCDLPEAHAAHDAISLTRRNLAELWMPLLDRILASDALIASTTTPLDRVRAEWTTTADWLTVDESVTRSWTDRRLIDAVIAHDASWRTDETGDPLVPAGDLFDDAMREIARRAAFDDGFAEQLLAAAGDTATLGVIVAGASFGPTFTAAVGRRLLGPASSQGLLPDARSRHELATGLVLERLVTWPDVALDLLGDDVVREGLLWREGLPTGAVREFVAAGLHQAVRDDPTELQRSLDVLAGFVPAARRTPFPAGLAQGIAAAVGTHMAHLGPLLDPGAEGFLDVAGTGRLTVGGEPVSDADLVSLYGRVVRDPDAQLLLELGLTDLLVELLADVPPAAAKASGSQYPVALGDLVRTQIEPAVKALRLVFGDAAVHEQRRIEQLLARRTHERDQLLDVGLSLAGMLTVSTPVSALLKVADDLRPSAASRDDGVPDNAVLARLDGVVAREALRLVVADDQLRAAAGLDVLDDENWQRLVAAASDPAVDFANRGTLLAQLAIEGPDELLVDSFFARATGTADATG